MYVYVTVRQFLELPSAKRNTLTDLDFECCDKMTVGEFKQVCAALLDCKQLKAIMLVNAEKLNPEYFQELYDTLSQCSTLKEYRDDLEDRSDDNIFNAYWSFVKKLEMTSSGLYECDKLTRAQLSKVCDIFSNKPELKKLSLRKLHGLDIQSCQMLFESIKNIKNWDLGNNNLATHKQHFKVICEFITNAPNLSKLCLLYNQLNKLDDESFQWFCDAIERSPALAELELENNDFIRLSEERFQMFKQAVQRCRSLVSITGMGELQGFVLPLEEKAIRATSASRNLILCGIFTAHKTEKANEVKRAAAEKLTQDGLKDSLLCFANSQAQEFLHFLEQRRDGRPSSSSYCVDIDIRLCLFCMLNKLVDKIPRNLEGTDLLSAFKEQIKDIQAWDLNIWKLITKERLSDYLIASTDSMIKKYVEDKVIPALKTTELIGIAELAKETAESADRTRRWGFC